jgi:hypothetical protein
MKGVRRNEERESAQVDCRRRGRRRQLSLCSSGELLPRPDPHHLPDLSFGGILGAADRLDVMQRWMMKEV